MASSYTPDITDRFTKYKRNAHKSRRSTTANPKRENTTRTPPKKHEINTAVHVVKRRSPVPRLSSPTVVEAIGAMKIGRPESTPLEEHSDKRLAVGAGHNPASSLTTKSEGSSPQPLYKPQRTISSPSPAEPDFGPRALAGNKRLFNPSDSLPTPAVSVSSPSILQWPVQLPRIHKPQSFAHPQTAFANAPTAAPRGLLPAPRPAAPQGRRGAQQGGMFPPSVEMIKQPPTRPLSQEQLVAEVKGIYAGLVMVEGKCIQVDLKQAQLAREMPPGQQPALSNEQYQALIALHRTLLQEHHDFFLASQHPAASAAVKRLAVKYSMPARLWRHGIHSFLELLRNRLPQSLDYMLAFIYLAYSMMTLLLETVPAFEDTWIECLGDLGRYRMAIEDDNHQDREIWTKVARQWYLKSANRSPITGRLYHHLAILARPDPLSQLLYYGKSLSVPAPFQAARESIMTLFGPALNPKGRQPRFAAVNGAFVRCHAIIFTGEADEKFEESMEEYKDGLGAHIERGGKRYVEQGHLLAISNCMAVLSYGAETNPLNRLIMEKDPTARQPANAPPARQLPQMGAVAAMAIQECLPPPDCESQTNVSLSFDKLHKRYHLTTSLPKSLETYSDCAKTLKHALDLFYATAKIHLERTGDINVLTFVHVTLVFLQYMSKLEGAMDIVGAGFPWKELSSMLNGVMSFHKPSDYSTIEGEAMPKPKEPVREKNLGLQLPPKEMLDMAGQHDETIPPATDEFRPFPEEWAMRGLKWTEKYFPDTWFVNENVEMEKHDMESESMRAEQRPQRVLWLGVQLAKTSNHIAYNETIHKFSAQV